MACYGRRGAAILVLFFMIAPARALIDLANCTFETSTCGWQPNGSRNHDWKTGSSLVNWLNPYGDHTFEISGKGRYFGTVGPSSTGWASSLESVLIQPSDNICGLRFAYSVDYHGILEVQLYPSRRTIAKMKPSYLEWTTTLVPLKIVEPSNVLFVMSYSANFGGEAAVDDVQFLSCRWCTFEGNFCSWSTEVQQSSNKVLWKISPLSSHRPAIDHTTMSSQGRYVFVDGWSSRGKVAQLVSRTFNEDDNVCFVKFVLYMYNVKSSDSLSLFIVDKQNNTIKRFENVSGIISNNWHPIEMGSLNSPPSPQWRFVIQGNFDVNSNARVALDDIEYLSCPNMDPCTFSSGTCSWNYAERNWPLPINILSWRLQQDPNNLAQNKLVAEFTSSDIPSDQHTVQLESRLIYSDDNICSLRLVYELDSSLIFSSLRVNVIHPNGSVGSSFVTAARDGSGRRFQKDVFFDVFPVSVAIFAEREGTEMGVITLHSLQYLPCTYSSFEGKGSGIWIDAGLPVGWTKRSAPCLQSQACPPRDHTVGLNQKGYFLLADSTTSLNKTAAAGLMLSSKLLSKSCGVRGWVYIARGKVRVSIREPDGSQTIAFWTSAKQWTYEELAFINPARKLEIEVTRSTDEDFSLAFDDIELTSCPDKQPCTFERSFCDWVASTSRSMNSTWIRWNGRAPSVVGQLALDHTKNSSKGHYAYMALQRGNGNKLAVLTGIPLGGTTKPCGIKFWYRIVANDLTPVAWLAVVEIIDGKEMKTLWNMTNAASGNEWQEGYATLNAKAPGVTTRVEFRGFTRTASSVIALDDVGYSYSDECRETTQATDFQTTTQAQTATMSASAETSKSNSPIIGGTETSRSNSPTIGGTETSKSKSPTIGGTETSKSKSPTIGGTETSNPTIINGGTEASKSNPAIIGGAIGAVLLVSIAAVVIVIVLYMRKKKIRWMSKVSTASGTTNDYDGVRQRQGETSEAMYAEPKPVATSPKGKGKNKKDDDGMTVNVTYRNPLFGRQTSFDSVSKPFEESVYAEPYQRDSRRASENALYYVPRAKSQRSSENAIYEET